MSLSSLEMSPSASKNAKERRNRRKKKRSLGTEEYGEDQKNPKCDYDDSQRRMVSHDLKRHLISHCTLLDRPGSEKAVKVESFSCKEESDI